MSWLWSLPLLLITVLIHVSGLLVLRDEVIGLLKRFGGRRPPSVVVGFVIGTTVLFITLLHAIEAALWGLLYLGVGALPNVRVSMLYSLSAMTTYGHANIYLADYWQMLGAIEALNGVVLFGLTTAALFSIIEQTYRMDGRRGGD